MLIAYAYTDAAANANANAVDADVVTPSISTAQGINHVGAYYDSTTIVPCTVIFLFPARLIGTFRTGEVTTYKHILQYPYLRLLLFWQLFHVFARPKYN